MKEAWRKSQAKGAAKGGTASSAAARTRPPREQVSRARPGHWPGCEASHLGCAVRLLRRDLHLLVMAVNHGVGIELALEVAGRTLNATKAWGTPEEGPEAHAAPALGAPAGHRRLSNPRR